MTAAQLLRDEEFWALWGRRALLALGMGQLLAGIVFFFAYNWQDLSDVAKFAIVEAALLVAAVAAIVHGIDKAFGQAALIGASMLTGVLLAIIGQVFQTGADVFELFLAWAVLILPWAIAARSAWHWLLWLVVAEIALAFYGEQVLVALGLASPEQIWVLAGATIVAALAVREIGVRFAVNWLSAHWTRLVLVFAAAAILFVPAAGEVLEWRLGESQALCLAAFAGASAAGVWCYWRLLPDFAALVILIGIVDAFVICVGFRLIDEAIGFSLSDAGPALASSGAMIAWAIAATGGAALAMRHLRAALKAAS